MTEKDLRKLNRYQLLEMLIIQTERADELQRKLEETLEQLNSRDVKLTVMGSIAEASLHLGGVFEAAQNAADIYLKAAQERAEAMEADARQQAEQILNDARRQAQQILNHVSGLE